MSVGLRDHFRGARDGQVLENQPIGLTLTSLEPAVAPVAQHFGAAVNSVFQEQELSPLAQAARGMSDASQVSDNSGYKLILAKNEKDFLVPMIEDGLDGRPVARGAALRAEADRNGMVRYLTDIVSYDGQHAVAFNQSNSPLLGLRGRDGMPRIKDGIEIAINPKTGNHEFNVALPGHSTVARGTVDLSDVAMLKRIPVMASQATQKAEMSPLQQYAANEPNFA